MRVKEHHRSADNRRVNFDLSRPTDRQRREGTISGLIAVSVTIPVIITALFLDGRPLHWGYFAGAMVCIGISVIYAASFMVLTNGKSNFTAQAVMVFVMVCLAIAALGLLELSSSNKYGTYTPAVLVGVVFVSIIGDHRMRIAVDVYAVGMVGAVGWLTGLRGTSLVAVVLVYASTIIIITWITTRTVGTLNENINFRRSISVLDDAFDGSGPGDAATNSDIIRAAYDQGLPFVTSVIPASRVAVFARHGRAGAIATVSTWPGDTGSCADLSALPEVAEALHADAILVRPGYCFIPIGYCDEGELVMVIERSDRSDKAVRRTREGAELIASSFLHATSRANFVSGLQVESRTDPLTGLANRRSLYERIEIEMAHALRSESPLSLAMIDLDYFKNYNDTHGHVAGDTLLRSIAALMISNIRGQDLAARYGGEEFCLVLPDTDLVGAYDLLEKLRAGGREATTDFGVTLSAGLTSWDGLEDTTSFIERADAALYRAKNSGRDRVVSIQSVNDF